MINKLTEGYTVKCDKKDCGRMMTFDYERSFSSLIERMKEIGWRAFKREERWINYCPKCIASAEDKKDYFTNKAIVFDEEEVEVIFRARKYFAGMRIFLKPRDVLKKIINDFGEELMLMERDLGAEERAPDLFSKGNKEEK